MTPIRYLAYGSNLLPARLAARLTTIRALGRIALPGWTLCFHKSGGDGSGKCDIVPRAGSVAYGAVYEISQEDRVRLDRIEGVGNGYRSTVIDVESVGNLYVYLAQSSHIDSNLVPYDWYHEFVVAGARHHGFPRAYIERIEAVATLRDDDTERRAENLRVLGRTTAP